MVADGFSQPVPVSQFEQANSAAFVMRPVSVFRVHFVLGHEVVEMTDVLFLRGPTQSAQSSPPPLENKNSQSKQENKEENASENEQKFRQEIPEIKDIDFQLQSDVYCSLLCQLNAEDEVFCQSVLLRAKDHQRSAQFSTAFAYLPIFSSWQRIAFVYERVVSPVLPHIDGLVIKTGCLMAEREDKDDIGIDFLSDTEEGVIIIGDGG